MPYDGQRSITPGLPPNPAYARQQRSHTPSLPIRGATTGSIDPPAYHQSTGPGTGSSSPSELPYDYDCGPDRECHRKLFGKM